MTAPRAGDRPDRDEVETRVGGYVEGLRDLVTNEQQSRTEYERLVDESKDRERRLMKAIVALEGGDMRASLAKPKPKPKAKQLIGREAVEKVWQTIRELTSQPGVDTVTRTQVSEASGISKEATRRALEVLRSEEKIRSAGKSGTGGPTAAKLWAVMPDA